MDEPRKIDLAALVAAIIASYKDEAALRGTSMPTFLPSRDAVIDLVKIVARSAIPRLFLAARI